MVPKHFYDREDIFKMVKKFILFGEFENVTTEDVDKWITVDYVLENEFLTENEIINGLTNEEDECVEELEDKSYHESIINLPKISHTEGMKTLVTSLRYFEIQENVTIFDLMALSKLRNRAARKERLSVNQKRITDHLNKLFF